MIGLQKEVKVIVCLIFRPSLSVPEEYLFGYFWVRIDILQYFLIALFFLVVVALELGVHCCLLP